MQETIDYILRFLLRDDSLMQYVGYTDNKNEWHKYKVVIVPSGFFTASSYGSESSMPTFPLPMYDNLPVIYGKAEIEETEDMVICHIDMVACVYFLISRYEEYVFPNTHRDEHERFIGMESLPARCGFLQRPIVEEYGTLLHDLLHQCGIETMPIRAELNNIYLTHDVDTITHYRRIRSIFGGIKRAVTGGTDKIKTIIYAQSDIHQDPAYTFPSILQNDNRFPKARQIYFIKAADNGYGYDYPKYNLKSKDFNTLIRLIKNLSPNAEIGLHCSYASYSKPEKIDKEKKRLQTALPDRKITASRHHYLRALQPWNMEILIKSGITDDYTMGYPDIAGFRLGTCRAVRLINPATRSLTNLTLHPLTVMDSTLNEPKYMNLTENQALKTTLHLISETIRHNGDLCLLWHNTSLIDTDSSYHKSLYNKIIDTLSRK